MTEYLVKFSGYLIIDADSQSEAQEETEMHFCEGLNLRVDSVKKRSTPEGKPVRVI